MPCSSLSWPVWSRPSSAASTPCASNSVSEFSMQSRHEAPSERGALRQSDMPNDDEKSWSWMGVASARRRRCRVRGFGLTCRSFFSVPCHVSENFGGLRLHLLRKSEFLDDGGSASYDAHDSFEQFFCRPVRSLCSARSFGSFVCTSESQSRMDLRGIIPFECQRLRT